MRTLFLGLAVGLLALAAAPQNALACHKDNPHGANTTCDGGESPDLEDLENRVTDLEDALSSLEAFVFVGFSMTEVNPITDTPGFPGMHAVCQETFGPVSRLCTAREYALSLNVVGAPTVDGAWVHPGEPFGRAGADCLGWAPVPQNSGGTIVTKGGGFKEITCNTTIPVTCCGAALEPTER